MTATSAMASFSEQALPAPSEWPSELDSALAQARALVIVAKARTVAFALDQLGDLELPETPASEDDQALLRSAATLYLAGELEAARLIDAAETLAGLTISGALPIPPGAAIDAITAFWRGRGQRFTDQERRAIFVRAFGAEEMLDPSAAVAGENHAFFELMLGLCEALYELERPGSERGNPSPRLEARARVAARALAENLLHQGGPMSAFAAQELTETLGQAVAMLKLSGVQQAFGARTLWATVSTIARRYWDAEPVTQPHVSRGKAGLTLLSWVADSLPWLDDPMHRLLSRDHPVILAAAEWLENSLTLRQTAQAAPEI